MFCEEFIAQADSNHGKSYQKLESSVQPQKWKQQFFCRGITDYINKDLVICTDPKKLDKKY